MARQGRPSAHQAIVRSGGSGSLAFPSPGGVEVSVHLRGELGEIVGLRCRLNVGLRHVVRQAVLLDQRPGPWHVARSSRPRIALLGHSSPARRPLAGVPDPSPAPVHDGLGMCVGLHQPSGVDARVDDRHLLVPGGVGGDCRSCKSDRSTASTAHQQPTDRSVRHVDEAGVVALEGDGDVAGGAVAVLGDDQVGLAGAGRLLLVDVVPMQKYDHVRILFQRSRFA